MKKRILAVMMSMLMAAGSLPYGTAAYGGELELVAEPTDLAFQEGIQDADEGSLIEEGFEGSGDIPEISSQPETSANPDMDAEGVLSDAPSGDGVYEPEESNGMEATDEGFGLLLEEPETETEPVSGLETGPDEGNAGDGLETVPDSVMISTEAFPDEHFRGYVEEHCDTDGDGILSTAEIDSVTEISVPSLSISSLQGIECFHQLKTLDCSSNLLTSLDLSGLPYLESLDCSDNQLSALDLSGNTSLSQVVISPQTVSAVPEKTASGWMLHLEGLSGAEHMGRVSFPSLIETMSQTGDGIALDEEQLPDSMTYLYDTGLQIDGEAAFLEVNVLMEILEEMTETEESSQLSAAIQESTVVSLGRWHSAAIKADGSLWMWGDNECGELGDGSNWSHRITPKKVMNDVRAVSLGTNHSAAIKTDGSLWMWGSNFYGELGDGGTMACYSPMEMMDGVEAVSLGNYSSAVIKSDGSLWMWGFNASGELGDGSREDRHTPVRVMDSVQTVSLGESHSAAVKMDGSLWMWGSNNWGELGDGSGTTQLIPVKVMDNVRVVSLGDGQSAAIKKDGSLWMWGRNEYGQLGDGSKTDRYTPVKVMDDVRAVSLGSAHSAAIKTDGSLWMWGSNFYGELGDGSMTERTTPVKVMDGVRAVALGGIHSAAVKTDGSLWMWGYNYFGQLGDGSTTDHSTPVMTLKDVYQEKEIPFQFTLQATYEDNSREKLLRWTKDGYSEKEIRLKVTISTEGDSVSLEELHVTLNHFDIFQVKDSVKKTNELFKYDYTINLNQKIEKNKTATFQVTLVKNGWFWKKPEGTKVYSGIIGVSATGRRSNGDTVTTITNLTNQLDIDYQNDVEIQKKISDEEKAKQEAEKNAEKSADKAIDAYTNVFTDLSGKLALDSRIETYLGHDQFEALKVLIYTEISLANISKSYFTAAGLSEQVAEKFMSKFLGYSNPEFGLASKDVPIEVVVTGKDNKQYQFQINCDISVYSIWGSEFGMFGSISTKMWEVKRPNQKTKLILDSIGLFSKADMKGFCDGVWGIAESSLLSAFKNVWGNDADKAANGIIEGSIDSLASKAAKYGLEQPVKIILKKFYEKKLKNKFSENLFKLLVYPSKLAVAHCPVDVYIYDPAGKLAGSIVDNRVTLQGDGMALWAEGEEKYIQLFEDNYRVVYKATGTGTMTLNVYDQTFNNIDYRNSEFTRIPLQEGTEYTQTVSQELLADKGSYSLRSNDGKTIQPDKEEFLYTDPQGGSTHTHTWDAGKVTKQASCIEPGIRTYTCAACGKTKQEQIPAAGHRYGAWKVTKQATALSEGLKERTCSACGSVEKAKTAKLNATMKVNASTVVLQVGQSTSKLKVSGLAKGDAVKSWRSGNKKIASVNKNGKITAKNKVGKTVITITLKSGLKKKVTVKVQKGKVTTSKITGVKKSLSLKVGKTKKLSPVISPITSSDKVTYSSSNKKVATVSSSGKITAKKKGTATVTVKSGKKKVTCKVNVK